MGANFDDWVTWPNTLKAHQLISFVTSPDRQGRGVEVPSTSECNAAIFDAMYECGQNISLVDTLVNIGIERLGVTTPEESSELRTHLENNLGAKDVMKEIQTGRKQYNIQSVPFFIIGTNQNKRPYGISGAQDPATFVEIFDEMAESLGD